MMVLTMVVSTITVFQVHFLHNLIDEDSSDPPDDDPTDAPPSEMDVFCKKVT